MVDETNIIKIDALLLDELKSVCPDGSCDSHNCEIAVIESLKKMGYSVLV